MKARISAMIVLLLVLSLTLAMAQTKTECPPTTPDGKPCCTMHSKGAMTNTGTAHSNVMLTSNKKGDTKAATTNHAECTDADKAQCDAKKSSATKASMKSDCCKNKTKTTKAEKKTAPEKTEAKGTN